MDIFVRSGTSLPKICTDRWLPLRLIAGTLALFCDQLYSETYWPPKDPAVVTRRDSRLAFRGNKKKILDTRPPPHLCPPFLAKHDLVFCQTDTFRRMSDLDVSSTRMQALQHSAINWSQSIFSQSGDENIARIANAAKNWENYNWEFKLLGLYIIFWDVFYPH